ncbi:hypothetical protein MKW98_011438 [Papaver atlanticum]|uniref:Ubiquitin thioesterase OTU n=1 Tax=Papaver atlanticum TaxID=357466 RepID=A0AAD4SIL7_9MAGN|nr:hypothetical protein MKW98_011438 [Papaver atlanticum]
MLGVLCARPKSWIVAALSNAHSGIHYRIATNPVSFLQLPVVDRYKRVHSSACKLNGAAGGGGGGSCITGSSSIGAASIWHGILPSNGDCKNQPILSFHYEHKGEGSWNVSSDVRPARWLHGSDSAWLLFGVCDCLAPIGFCDGNHDLITTTTASTVAASTVDSSSVININKEETSKKKKKSSKVVAEEVKKINIEANDKGSVDYRITGVLADGRCLFRALAHGVCLRRGQGAPDMNREGELADDLRAQVMDELLRRRNEFDQWDLGDFDDYVKRMRDPSEWGGEPELLMASHVLRTPISVFLIERSSGDLINITNYGQEYEKNNKPIKVLFHHHYGHYDLLETLSDKSYQKVESKN